LIRFVTLLVGALLIGGCSTPGPSVLPGSSTGATASSAPTAIEAPDPASITVPKIDAHSTLIPLGLDDTGALAVPPVEQPMQASWYAGMDPVFDGDEYDPGEVGPAVIAGHVDGVIDGRKGQPGIFHRLSELVPGDEVLIERKDGVTLRFVVYAVERHAKDAFPSDRVYAPTVEPELRLITCGGAFDRGSGHYVDNWVIFAKVAA
jgi:hypothetical protein